MPNQRTSTAEIFVLSFLAILNPKIMTKLEKSKIGLTLIGFNVIYVVPF